MSDQMSVADVARVCHEVNRSYRKAIGQDGYSDWDSAPDWMQRSVLSGVRAHLADPVNAKDSHDRWVAYRKAEGWKYGKVRNDSDKVHPNVCAWSKLPESERIKDELFVGVINALSRRYEIVS